MRVTPDSVPRLRRGVRRQFDKTRDTAVLMAPERVIVLDDIADAIIMECDGHRSVAEIVTVLAARYQAPEDEISSDVTEFFEDLAQAALVTL
ncbi:pyrroloquinoline quinone biosynthesis peptide chaperone PqqD [Acidocella aminolytica]|uniref:Coenzyme pyrrolo-quinoline quinone (PQQ) synthesis protein D PqqD n=1 Tax=Acidocella aminolytica 101 = DSM 11237 TaxID=1120923 RepID=A0A0D6PET8_9PROT|nr:pyrroloquinoline quinone biosynthesis peptide chaperone PqqD [Acidocella aminolytica]GAN79881.1 coenzyme pyrrolo-quinoline quinone (PQQ) synthesis protein D PqqD [Acidocella aminolytica 101 = DSM 11237]GBQ40970.1 pyrrolo-quinoline quinone synthesis protein PqqD [Acidocella aminolytica 101 = DSM 11237]SHE60407.1 pyrroloquinoline quinone biosynthesis protein D [Acidocella aminolytica 101 = DSM 11237]